MIEKTIIELKDIKAGYNNQTVLENVNISIKSNDFIGVIGPNGGGKTTLVKVILGLLKPLAGKIAYHFPNQSKTATPYIGYLPQSLNFDQHFPISVKEVILSGLSTPLSFFIKTPKYQIDRLNQYAEITGVNHLLKKPFGELSGGQRQRVLLSRALISDPKLLILDEPNTYVDNKFEGELYELLNKINSNLAIIIVSHDIGVITQYVKTIACVNYHLHYHQSNIISNEQLLDYNCPIQLITHGYIPHTVLEKH